MQARRASRELELRDLRRIQWLLGGLLVFVSLGSLLFLEVEAWGLLAVVLAAMAAALLWPELPGRIPAWVHRLAFPGILAAFAAELWLTADLFQSLIHLDLLLLLYRGFFYRSRREDLQLVLLGLFLLVVAGVVTASPVFALQLLAFAACALALLFTATIADAADPGSRDRKLPLFVPYFAQRRPDWIAGLSWRALAQRIAEVLEWRLLALAAALFACVVAVSALLFVSIPRFDLQNSLFLERFATHRARTGFNDSIRFGEVTEISKDSSVAFSMDVSDPALLPPVPYFRMLVLDEYLPEGGFRMSPFLRRRLLSRDFHVSYLAGNAPRGQARGVWTIYLEPGVSRYLPIPGRFGGLRLRDAQGIQYDPSEGIVALRSDPLTMTAYRINGVATGGLLPDPSFLRRWRAVPHDSQRGRADLERLELNLPLDAPSRLRLAGWVSAVDAGRPVAEDPRRFALDATDWLRRRHAYSLNCAIPAGAGDPLVRWMASDEPGYCELFAGSLVMLCRSAGIPARVAVGFKGGAWNAYAGSFTVRDSDAHAWCEVWDGRGNWIRADPTPGAIAVAGVSASGPGLRDWGVDRGFGARLNSLRVFWYRRIVSFDAGDQAGLVRSARESARAARLHLLAVLDKTVDRLRSAMAREWSRSRSALAAWALGLGAAAFLVWGAFRIAAGLLRWRAAGSRPSVEAAVRREAGRLISVLKKRRRWQDPGAPFDALRSDLLVLRFGRPEGWPDARPCFRRARRWSAGR